MSIMKLTDQRKSGNTTLEIYEYPTLGASTMGQAQAYFYAEKMNLRKKRIKVTLNGSEVITEAGKLHFMKGNIDIDAGTGSVGGFLRRAVTGLATGESIVRPRYKGTGELWLEPSYAHYLTLEVDNDTLVCDRGAFVCATNGLDIGIKRPDSVMSGLLSGDGLFQTQLKGSGVAILESPVPYEELEVIEMNNDVLKVDGDFALARVGNFTMSIERSTRSIIGAGASGEGLLTVFRGTGVIWLAPSSDQFGLSAASMLSGR